MGVFRKRALENSNFLTTHAGLMNFSGWTNIKKTFSFAELSKTQTF